MNSGNHYHVYGIADKIFKGDQPVLRNLYAVFQEGKNDHFETSVVIEHRGIVGIDRSALGSSETIDRSALEKLADQIVRHQIDITTYSSKSSSDIALAFTFKPAYDAVVAADGEQRMFELNAREQDAFMAYVRTKLLSIKEL